MLWKKACPVDDRDIGTRFPVSSQIELALRGRQVRTRVMECPSRTAINTSVWLVLANSCIGPLAKSRKLADICATLAKAKAAGPSRNRLPFWLR